MYSYPDKTVRTFINELEAMAKLHGDDALIIVSGECGYDKPRLYYADRPTSHRPKGIMITDRSCG